MTLAACMKHSPIHRFGMGWRCSRCNVPITNPHGMIVDMPDEIVPGPILDDLDHAAAHPEINHTEPREFDEFIKRQLAAMSTLLENSWRASLRKERDARLHEVRLKEKFKKELADMTKERDDLQVRVYGYQQELFHLEGRVEALQKNV